MFLEFMYVYFFDTQYIFSEYFFALGPTNMCTSTGAKLCFIIMISTYLARILPHVCQMIILSSKSEAVV